MERQAVYQTQISGLEKVHQGKVRDIYAVGDDHLLIVTTDRISAFDVVLPEPIPGKGRVLTQISNFWFRRTADIVPNHLSDFPLEHAIADAREREWLAEQAVIVRRLDPYPIEAVVRGYLIGSGWRDYRETGAVCGIRLPAGLELAIRLPEPLFTPATKAPAGEHDVNISAAELEQRIGREASVQIHDAALALYRRAAAHALERGIVIADTKFEFGRDTDGSLVLIDEVLTPDSSRFWPIDGYRVGTSPPSFDKQYVRDYLESLDWNKRPPAPHLPPQIIARTREKYQEALRRLTGVAT